MHIEFHEKISLCVPWHPNVHMYIQTYICRYIFTDEKIYLGLWGKIWLKRQYGEWSFKILKYGKSRNKNNNKLNKKKKEKTRNYKVILFGSFLFASKNNLKCSNYYFVFKRQTQLTAVKHVKNQANFVACTRRVECKNNSGFSIVNAYEVHVFLFSFVFVEQLY